MPSGAVCKVPKEILENVVASYLAGESNIAALGRKFSLNTKTIVRTLELAGVYQYGAIKQQRLDNWPNIIAEYDGKSLVELAKKYGMTLQGLRTGLNKRGISTPKLGDAWVGRVHPKRGTSKYTLNSKAFARPLYSEAAYWVGMLLADGCVRVSDSPYKREVTLSLKLSDRNHIEKFASFLSTDIPIRVTMPCSYRNGEGIAYLTISNEELINDLLSFNITPRKSMKEIPPAELLNNIDFWRGVVDGDGSVLLIKDKNSILPTLNLVGSEELITKFLYFTKNPYAPKKGGLRIYRRKQNKLCTTKFSGKLAKELITILYKDATISLDRKQTIANSIIKGDS